MLFLPLSLTQHVNVYASLKPSSINNKLDIPFVIPLETTPKTDLVVEESSTDQRVVGNTTSLQSSAEEINDHISALATCDKLPISAITANGNDGNVPSNAIDNNLNTRWSNLGQGSWIQLDLGSKKSICSVDIAWYRGDIRQNNFVISVSDDGTTFANKFSGISGGSTTSPEKYTMPSGTEGRYIRTTVNGNTENDWASITEIAAFGSSESGGSGVVGSLFHKWQTSAGSSTWSSSYASLGGGIRGNSDAVVIANADGRLQVFVVGTGGSLFTKVQTSAGSSTWSAAWQSLGGVIKENTSPAVVRNSDGRLQVFVVGTGGSLFTKVQTSAGSSTWSAWSSLGGGIAPGSSPAVSINSDGRLDVFVIGTGKSLFHKVQTSAGSSTWSTWSSLGGVIKENTSPAVALNSNGRLDVFVIGTGGSLFHKVQTSAGSSTWSSWQSLGGVIKENTSPAVVRNSDGRLQVFVIGTGGSLFTKVQTSAGSSTWSTWSSLGGGIAPGSSPAVSINSDGRLDVFVIGTGNSLFHKVQTSAGSSTWSTWSSLGGVIALGSSPTVARNNDGRLDSFVIGGGTGDGGGNGGGSTTRDGVTVPFKIKGQWDYEYETDERDGGARYNMNAAGTSLVMVGYFRSSGGSDDVAMKILGGRHSSSIPYDGCVYDPAIDVDSGRPRLRAECPHPDYTGNLDLDFEQQGVSIHNRWVGFMAVALQEQAGVRIQVYQDQGNNNNQPANQWVKVLEFFDDGTKVSGIEGADRFPLRELPDTAQNTFRIDETPGLQEKWLAIAEIDLS